MVGTLITDCTKLSVRYAALSAIGVLFLTLSSLAYAVLNFSMNTDTTRLVSPHLEWRQQDAALKEKFPQPENMILIVIDGATAERAQQASQALIQSLAKNERLILSMRELGGGAFFEKHGLLYLPLEQTQSAVNQIIAAQPFLGSLAADPTLRGVMDSLSTALEGVAQNQITLDRLHRPIAAFEQTISKVLSGGDPFHSWRTMMLEGEPDLRETRRVIETLVSLDFGRLEPGGEVSRFIRDIAASLQLDQAHGVRVRLTGPAPIFDEEFASLTDGAIPIAVGTIGAMLIMLWFALGSPRLIGAVIATVLAGLAITTALGLIFVGAFNIISVAFVALFVGLGVDFGIQFGVRYRAECREGRSVEAALVTAANQIGPSLTLAAAAITAGFLGFLPTSYRGVAELGLIAGSGMVVTYALSLTFLPALIRLMGGTSHTQETGFLSFAAVDGFLERRAQAVLAASLALGGVAILLLPYVVFDFNLLNLRSTKTESISTLLDLAHDPDRSPNAMDALAPTRESAKALAAKLAQLPSVAKVVTIDDLIPREQDAKLALIADAQLLLDFSLNPVAIKPDPSDAELVASIRAAAAQLRKVAIGANASVQAALALATKLDQLADGGANLRSRASLAMTSGLETLLNSLRNLLLAEPVDLSTLPADIARDFVAPDGQLRVRIYPKGDPTDTSVLSHFRAQVQQVAPEAVGVPVFLEESGKTIVGAFVEAGLYSVVVITLLLTLALRSWTSVAAALVPLVLAGALTLATCAVFGLKLNYANIIALPLLFGIGVAFDIYFVMAWRQGERELLSSPLTRAVMFSAGATSTGFGALWFSSHPGTSSMGLLLMISLFWILAVVLFVLPPLLRLMDRLSPSPLTANRH